MSNVSAPTGTLSADLLYSDSERDLAAALQDILSARSSAEAVRARTEQPETCDVALWKDLSADIGIGGLLVPESLGGAGASYRELTAAAEQLGAFVAPVPYLGSAAVATAAALSAATAGGAREGSARLGAGIAADVLRQLAEGTLTAALAVDVSLAPSAPFPADVRLSGPEPGDAAAGIVRLRGTIMSVPDALPATVLLVPAEGVPNGLYLVEATAPGVHRAPVTSLDMTRQLCDIMLDGAPARQIAVGSDAADAVEAGLRAGAVVLAAEQLGLAQRCLDMTVAYLKERRQFARQIGSFQGLKHRLADLWAAIAQARAASRYAATCLSSGDAAALTETRIAVALAKSACSEVAVTAAQECVQMHGGIGFTWEHPAHLYLKRAKAASVAFGTPGAHRAALAALVNLPA
ncbi:MAG TPA: acyl-CoA dehydrogenase family protein [Trebonia sp.]|nr:acyl-CoA dehydrogenase family protein [Trebonia sp.]